MKKVLAVLLTILLITGILSSCGLKKSGEENFGDFDYNGVYLTEQATKAISMEKAKGLIKTRTLTNESGTGTASKVRFEDEEDVMTSLAIMGKYASMVATTKYYISDLPEEQTRVDIYQGTDFLSVLDRNLYEPFGQMIVKYIYVDDKVIDQINQENELFSQDILNLRAPFSSPYTFHMDDDGNLVIQSHSFAELPASVNGGIGSTFRQDSEYLFDEEGKIVSWQSSLGIYTSTPTGTIKQGYIFSVSFEWMEKE